MDGRGRWFDNLFVERQWRSVKYEEVYLKGYESLGEARQGLGEYFEFYYQKRRHQDLTTGHPMRSTGIRFPRKRRQHSDEQCTT
jgi:putative transposase